MADDAKGAELAVRTKELEAAYRAVIQDDPSALPTAADPDVMTRLIMERIASAETFEEAFSPQKLDAWRDRFLGVAVKVLDVRFNRSTIEGGKGAPIYAVVDLEDLRSAERATVHCGGRNVLVQLIKMLEKGPDWQERPVKLVDKQTGEGYKVLWLEAA